jgi:hypothetical protein
VVDIRFSTKTNIISVCSILQLMAHVDKCADYYQIGYCYVLTSAWCLLCACNETYCILYVIYHGWIAGNKNSVIDFMYPYFHWYLHKNNLTVTENVRILSSDGVYTPRK